MRQLVYKINSENAYTYVFTYAEAQNFKSQGYTVEIILSPIPEERYHDDLIPWIQENGKLVRQHV